MQTLITVLGVGAVIAGVAGYIWYKIRHAAEVESSEALVAAKVEAQAAQIAELQTQIEAKNEQERVALNEKVVEILAVPDQGEKRRRALELLATLRGAH